MSTSNPITTISYNTESFLKETLDHEVEMRRIQWYAYIKHDAEVDETKDHFHVLAIPNRLTDLMDFQFLFREIDEKNPKKPLGVMPCRAISKDNIDDWLPYVLHDRGYLALKHECREFFYRKEDMVTSDDDYYDYLYRHAFKASKWAKDNELLTMLKNEEIKPHELVERGYVSMQMATQINAYYYMKTHYGVVDRNGREGHEDGLE